MTGTGRGGAFEAESGDAIEGISNRASDTSSCKPRARYASHTWMFTTKDDLTKVCAFAVNSSPSPPIRTRTCSRSGSDGRKALSKRGKRSNRLACIEQGMSEDRPASLVGCQICVSCIVPTWPSGHPHSLSPLGLLLGDIIVPLDHGYWQRRVHSCDARRPIWQRNLGEARHA